MEDNDKGSLLGKAMQIGEQVAQVGSRGGALKKRSLSRRRRCSD